MIGFNMDYINEYVDEEERAILSDDGDDQYLEKK